MKSSIFIIAIALTMLFTMCKQHQNVMDEAKNTNSYKVSNPPLGAPKKASIKDEEIIGVVQSAIALKYQDTKADVKLTKLISVNKQVVSGIKYSVIFLLKDNGRAFQVKAELWHQKWLKDHPLKILSWQSVPYSE